MWWFCLLDGKVNIKRSELEVYKGVLASKGKS